MCCALGEPLKSTFRDTMSTNSTTNIVSWAPNPDGRGTIDLLWSCFATVFLCTWSAIHPNLPALGEKGSRIFFRRLSYVLGCIIAPECYAALALWELSVALNYKAQVRYTACNKIPTDPCGRHLAGLFANASSSTWADLSCSLHHSKLSAFDSTQTNYSQCLNLGLSLGLSLQKMKSRAEAELTGLLKESQWCRFCTL